MSSATLYKLRHLYCWFLIIVGTCSSSSSYNIHAISTSSSPLSHVSFSLTHRDAAGSPLRSAEADPADLHPAMPLHDFVASGRALRGRLTNAGMHKAKRRPHVVGALSYGGDSVGEFYLTVPVGTPSQNMIFLVDTGSELTWTQCSPCPNCTATGPAAPRFNYSQSSSLLLVGCHSQFCINTTAIAASCSNAAAAPLCQFDVRYVDGSQDAGFFALDAFNLSPGFSKPFIFGCAVYVQDIAPSASSGLMGLDVGPLSFTSQLFASNRNMPRKFAYWLPDRITNLNTPGRIEFGNYNSRQPGAEVMMYTPLAPSPDQAFYVTVEGMAVGAQALSINLAGAGDAVQTVFDSGAVLTHLVKPVYDEMVAEMQRQTEVLQLGPFNGTDEWGYDLCYMAALNATELPQVPSISLRFTGGAALELGPGSILFAAASNATSIVFCLAFQQSGADNLNMIGNYQQQNYWVEYNLETSSLGLAKAHCATLY